METLCNSRAVCVWAVLTFAAILPFAQASQGRGVNSTIAPLKFDLPTPGFGSTPPNLGRIRNLEPLRKTPRPPFYAPAGATNLALGKPVASTDDLPVIGELEMITDGDKRAQDGSFVELGPFVQHVTIDLEEVCEIYAIVVWHWQVQARVYSDVVVQIADDADFVTNVRTVFNNDTDNSAGLGVGRDRPYVDTHEGRLIDVKGQRARYVRLHSNGNQANDLNHYTEVEVWGQGAITKTPKEKLAPCPLHRLGVWGKLSQGKSCDEQFFCGRYPMKGRAWLQVVLSGVIAVGGVGVGADAAAGEIRLIVRGDDIGSSHAANVACIRSYREGILRSVEVMVPCPWFNEAVKMLDANPGLDVGVHLTLTSEWENIKWGPLTHAPSLVDEQGNFYPMVWPNKNFGPNTSLMEAKPRIEEVERELRAQIELAVKKIKNVSHLTGHMGFAGASPEIKAVVDKLAAEYKLPVRPEGAKSPPRLGRQKTAEEKEAAFVKMLEGLEDGLWLFVEHPGLDTPEMRAIGHKGYEDVAADRDGVTKMFTSEKVKAVIKRRGIKLVSYADAFAQSPTRREK